MKTATTKVWWQEALQAWSLATGQDFAVHAYEDERPYRTLGEWWKDGAYWRLHLSASQYATFGTELDTMVRRTLTWSLQTVQQQRTQHPQTLVIERLSELLRQANLSPDTWAQAEAAAQAEIPGAAAKYRDGYFVLVHPNQPGRLSQHEDFQSEWLEVIDAVFPGARLGFVEVPNQPPLVLLYCSAATLIARAADAHGQPVARMAAIRTALTELADALESDVMIPCSMFVSRALAAPSDLPEALFTLALQVRQRARLSAKRNLFIWGENPIQIVLAGLPNRVVQWFTEAADVLHALPPELNDELREAMMGLVAANLNVSEAARGLYVHRNTLINRLERIRESSGYDLRVFADALVMWLRLVLEE